MTPPTLATTPLAAQIPRPRRPAALALAPEDLDGALPMGLLEPTGRADAVHAAWIRGELGEAPTGVAWDTVRLPATVARETLRQLRAARAPVGPVLAGPLGVEFIVVLGSADGWEAPGWETVRSGTLILMPSPKFTGPYHVGDRTWWVAPPVRPLFALGADLHGAYLTARALTEEARR
ncbi:hypothetical protein [Streptomyces sp. URMC 125]|uniref:hypothetical protein n=1 Tax=Streptomyces sp. URMC 125 TaxID=3423419 RepID=UPI003F1CBDF5